MSLSWGPSDRSTSASKSGHDSSRMLRSRFLCPSVLAGQEVPLGSQRPRRRDRRARVPDRQERVGDTERRLRDDHRVPLVGLGVAGEEPGGPVRRESRQVRRRHPGCPGAGEREGAYVARLVDDHERVGEAAEQRVQVSLPVRDGGAEQHLAVSGRDTHAQWDDFPTSSPMTASGILVDATVVSSNR